MPGLLLTYGLYNAVTGRIGFPTLDSRSSSGQLHSFVLFRRDQQSHVRAPPTWSRPLRPTTPLLSCPRRPRIGLTTRIARQRTPARSLKRCLKLQPNHRHDTLWYLCQPNAMGFMVSRRILVRLSFTAACTRAIIHSIK
ncbi:hypothetical protein PC116_g25653 [Phytophthora cactorum]|uniref:Uncharacterized protein n=1 Tax=Phytophthora cactorum TaxID=29920 RepID=A0A8T0YDF2_9STRA|nr:hypothetical protein Pcac1_g6163 [Phytophthora cactorum]KAG2797986.1 hypothetical protein PC111_g21047 [Phytophthora cactorum]KAG2828624.1 hypothetical protein PC113_g21436 [Phytophthora cactorum]KAG2884882.1 hypothetical protein PC115_g21195 [Phytophthora cactorum]KAG2894846.1 hypothetical protein PC117_g23383 [Phytophthora cactorum]